MVHLKATFKSFYDHIHLFINETQERFINDSRGVFTPVVHNFIHKNTATFQSVLIDYAFNFFEICLLLLLFSTFSK